MISTCPRGGDELATASQLDQARRENRQTSITRLLEGGNNWAVGLNTDMGYARRQANLRNAIPTLAEQIQDSDALHIHPVRPGEPCYVYDSATDTVRLDARITDDVRYAPDCKLNIIFTPVIRLEPRIHLVLQRC